MLKQQFELFFSQIQREREKDKDDQLGNSKHQEPADIKLVKLGM